MGKEAERTRSKFTPRAPVSACVCVCVSRPSTRPHHTHPTPPPPPPPHTYPTHTLSQRGLELPIHGDGLAVRSYLYVEDVADAYITVLLKGATGETYNIGG